MGFLHFLGGVEELGLVPFEESIDVDNGRVFGIGLGLDMLQRARRPTLMARNAAIHTTELPINIVAVLFIINLVIELLRGINRYLGFRKLELIGFSDFYIG